jgi:hypothetical protein
MMSGTDMDDQVEPLEITNPNRAWVVAQLEQLLAEWLTWQQEVEKIVDQPYDRQTQSEVFADGEAMMLRHDVLQAKTLTFLNNNIRGHGFIRGFDGHGADRTDLRLRVRVQHRLHRLTVLKESLQYAKVPDRPSSLEIVTAYLRAAHEERNRGEQFASGTAVERQLSLSQFDGLDFMRELEEAGLIKMAEAENAVAYYRLTLKGLASAERLTPLEALVRERESTIDASPAPAEEKRAAKFRLRDEIGKELIRRGMDYVFTNFDTIYQKAQAFLLWLKS